MFGSLLSLSRNSRDYKIISADDFRVFLPVIFLLIVVGIIERRPFFESKGMEFIFDTLLVRFLNSDFLACILNDDMLCLPI
jgi:hypothetical protein